MNQEEHTMLIAKIKFKTTMLKSSLCDYSDAYILVKQLLEQKMMQHLERQMKEIKG